MYLLQKDFRIVYFCTEKLFEKGIKKVYYIITENSLKKARKNRIIEKSSKK